MHNAEHSQYQHALCHSSARPCKRPGHLADQLRQHSAELYPEDCYSQPESSSSAISDMEMLSPADGADGQLESALQCEEHNQCLSSPQESDTSARSYQDASSFYSPVRAPSTHPFQHPLKFELSGPSLAEVPPYALKDTHSIACYGKQPCPNHSSYLLCSCIASSLLRPSTAPLAATLAA